MHACMHTYIHTYTHTFLVVNFFSKHAMCMTELAIQ